MDDSSAGTLIIRFGSGFSGNNNDPEEPDPPCPVGFSGTIPTKNPPGSIYQPGEPEEPEEPEDTTKLAISFDTYSAGKILGNWRNDSNGPKYALEASFTVGFGKGSDGNDSQCPNWASILCWKPIPLDYIGFYISDVWYSGDYEHDMALPTLSGTYDQDNNKIILTQIEVPGENDEEPTQVKPSIRVMWPPGDLKKYIKLEHYLNPWYEIETRVRTKLPKEGKQDAELPPMWIQGPIIGGDQKGKGGSPTVYALRVPVVFTWAEGEVPPGVPAGAVGIETYQEFLTAEDAFKPQGDGMTVQVADMPKEGEEYAGPGVDLTEDGLNEWLTRRGEDADPLTAGFYTLLMEIRPAWGLYTVKGKYLCGTEVRDLSGEYGFYREPSIFLEYPMYKVPVAYLNLAQITAVLITIYSDSTPDEGENPRTYYHSSAKFIKPVESPWLDDSQYTWNDYIFLSGYFLGSAWPGQTQYLIYGIKMMEDKLDTSNIHLQLQGFIENRYWNPLSRQIKMHIKSYSNNDPYTDFHFYQWPPEPGDPGTRWDVTGGQLIDEITLDQITVGLGEYAFLGDLIIKHGKITWEPSA